MSFILSPSVAQAALIHHRRASEVLSVPSIFLTISIFSTSSSVSLAALIMVPVLFCCDGSDCDLPSKASILSPFLRPVSYTHLRAHETRHDLVCRLLLEKKKQLLGIV